MEREGREEGKSLKGRVGEKLGNREGEKRRLGEEKSGLGKNEGEGSTGRNGRIDKKKEGNICGEERMMEKEEKENGNQ